MFQLYHGENKLLSMIWWWCPHCTRPNKTNNLRWNVIVLGNWIKSHLVDMLLHSDTFFWFRAKQSLLLLLSAACLAEKQQIPIV